MISKFNYNKEIKKYIMVGVPKLSFQKFGSVGFMVLANVPNIATPFSILYGMK